MMRLIRILGITLGVLVALVVAALGAAYVLFPKERLVALASAQVEATTGRALTVGGAVTPSLYPVLGLRVEDVALANAPWGEAPALVSAQTVSVGVRLASLLSGRLDIDEVRLSAPVVALEVNADGDANWLLRRGAAAAGGGANADESAGGGAASGGPGLEIGAVTVVIEDGAASFTDAVSNVRYVARALSVSAALDSLTAPLRVTGEAAINDRPATLALTLDNPQAVLDGQAAEADLALTLADARLAYRGALTLAGLALQGDLSLAAPDVPALARSLGAAAPDVVRAVALDGAVAFGPDRVLRLDDLALRADAIALTGSAALDISADRPAVTARLRAEALDLTPYLAGDGGGAPSDTAAGGGGAGGGWSTAALDLSALHLANADVALQAASVDLGRATLSDLDAAATLNAGALDLRIASLRVFGGSLTGAAGVRDAATPSLRADLTLSGLQLQPTLAAAAGVDRLTGTGAATLDVATQGASVDAWMRGLGGSASVRLTDGAVLGVNLAAMVRQALGRGGGDGPRQTDFAEIAASFTIAGGVARNDDLRFQGPLLRADGAGAIDIGAQTLDYRLTPRAVATLQGQGGATDLDGLSVPLIIRGPWSGPSVQPDLAGLAQELLANPQGAADGLKALEQGAGAALGGQEGESLEDAAKRALDEAQENPAKAIEGLLGGGGLRGLFGD